MATITAKMVGDLRAKTGAGMMDCKKALTESDGDMEQAIDLLRKKGLSAAAKKSGRVAAEGMIAAAGDGRCGALVEVNSETDFVAKNEAFQNFAAGVAAVVLEQKPADVEALKQSGFPGQRPQCRRGTDSPDRDDRRKYEYPSVCPPRKHVGCDGILHPRCRQNRCSGSTRHRTS